MGKEHTHAIVTSSNERSLWLALSITSFFLIVEIIGSFVTGSLALLSDAAHMLTDASALAISLAAIHLAKRAADTRRTFGYHRFEILAAAFNAIVLFLIAIYIIYEAYIRLNNPAEIQTLGMLVIATLGLIVNLISMRLLAHGKEKSLNIKSAYLEVWSDMLGSVGVIVGAILIHFTDWLWLDSVIAIGIGLWVLPRTWILLKETVNILLEGVPEGIDLNELKKAAEKIPGVLNIHELHVWAITTGKVSLTAHVIIDKQADCDHVITALRNMLTDKYGIAHCTLQHEYKMCMDEKERCNFT